ncbi:MAG: isoaspartyl peptidase/L-asparaginase [bacterium]
MRKWINRNSWHFFLGILPAFILSGLLNCSSLKASQEGSSFGIVMHGGAGTILKENMTPELEQEYRAKLEEALSAGYEILKNDGSSLDAVEASIRILEDSPLFNSGKGAVFTNSGTNELDASIMDGKTLNAGAVAGVKNVKNPIGLARLVMEQSPHVMMAREGAEAFARQHGLETVDQEYFHTERRWEQLQRAIKAEKEKNTSWTPDLQFHRNTIRDDVYLGTVGAAALDKSGNLAAGTSTGGMTNKRFGRIGDSPVIGAGTYANNETCAISSTGHGEYFIRSVVAHDISAMMAYGGMSLQEAGDKVIMEKLVQLGGTGGVIAIDKDGNVAMPFNTAGMYRGYVRDDGEIVVKIYKD